MATLATAFFFSTAVAEKPALPTLLFTAETGVQPLPCRCKANPLGGWAERLAVVDSLRAGSATSLLLDSGGWLDGGPSPEVAALTARAHVLMGYDALNVGSAERRVLGGGELPEWAAALPLVSGHPDRPRGVPAFRIVHAGEARVGIVGVARFDQAAPTPVEQVGRTLAEMPETDIVVVLLAGGLGPMHTIADSHDRVDVVLYGDGARTSHPIRRRATTAAAPGTRGRHLGRLLLPEKGADLSACDYALVPIEPLRRSTPELLRLALEAAELHEGPQALLERTFTYE